MTPHTFDKYRVEGAYHWDALASGLKRHNAITAARYFQVVTACGPVEGRAVLDIGCGDARLAAMLVEGGARLVVGLDNERSGIDVGRVRMASDLAGPLRGRVALGCADALRLPVRSGAFDVVVMTDIVEHIGDVTGFVAEAARALSPRGMMVITTPYRVTEEPLDANHVREFYPQELRALLEARFEHVTIRLSDPVWLVQLYTMGGWSRLTRWAMNVLSAYARYNVFVRWPAGRYAAQITAVATGPRNDATRGQRAALEGGE